MRLDTKALRYLTADDWRVLTAVEQGSRNHEVVPTPLIGQLANLRGSSAVHKSISALAKVNLIARVKGAKYDGYRLTYGGLDYLALHAHSKQAAVYSVGNQIGVGKESDIFVVASAAGAQHVLKIHRLGRISFRTVKANRDYLRGGGRRAGSWMHMSRLAAVKEFAFMRALRAHAFAVPEPIAHNRHTILMGLVDAFPLRQIADVPDPAALYAELLEMILRLARFGLIHGDFNEFNILVKDEETAAPDPADPPARTLTPVLIDFPQMVSIDHPDAEFYFDRDVACIKRFFERRFHFTSDAPGPFLRHARKMVGKTRLDVEVEASGFSRKMAKDLETYMKSVGVDGDGDHGKGSTTRSEDDGGDDDDEEEEEEEGEDEDDNADHGDLDGDVKGSGADEQQSVISGNDTGQQGRLVSGLEGVSLSAS